MKLVNSMQVNRYTDRCIYSYKGINVMHDTYLGHFMQPQKQVAYVMLDLKQNEYPDVNLVEMYHEDGYGSPYFSGNEVCLQNAKEFIDKYLCH